jgi:lipopolysaccharide transport system ATP-binding protein
MPLIIDEVLAVGDLGFILKCFKTIDTIYSNTAIVFVSSNYAYNGFPYLRKLF